MTGIGRLEVGYFVLFAGSPGVGRVAEVAEAGVLVEFFESPANPSVGLVWKSPGEVKHCRLGLQSRVFFRDQEDRWRAGRIVGGAPPTYAVRIPNAEYDVQIHESRLRIRWERPPDDPLQVLLAGGQESPLFRDSRIPVRDLLLQERAASASATGILSSGVQIHQHQVNGAVRVLRDPVQRYMLADEVGMGKSIQAGYIIRQVLIDSPDARVLVLAPEALVGQWRGDLIEKFFLDDFALHGVLGTAKQRFEVLPHEQIADIDTDRVIDLLVVDEAHEVAAVDSPEDALYPSLAKLCVAAKRLLLISATPSMQRDSTHMALLHLLDAETYRWEDFDEFKRLLAIRRKLAYAVYSLDADPDPDNPELLALQFDAIRQILPADDRYEDLTAEALACCEQARLGDGDSTLRLAHAVAAVRTHIAETYRLHHRVIRNRRHRVLDQSLDDLGALTPFEVTGRLRPRLIALQHPEDRAATELLFSWLRGTSDAVIDQGLDATPYAAVLGVLVSRVGGSTRDISCALRYRIYQDETAGAELTSTERSVLASAPRLEHEESCLGMLSSLADEDCMAELVDAILLRAMRVQRTVVFTGPGSLAGRLAARIRDAAPTAQVHEHSRQTGVAASESALEAWRALGGMLVMDDSGEVGRNLQEANAVIHVRLPRSPNSLEQRLGRVDRYGTNPSAAQFVVSSPDAESIQRNWLSVLLDGYGVFDASISALQEAVDECESQLWADVVTTGVDAFLDRVPLIQEAMRLELRRVNELDELESIFEESRTGTDIALSISRFELHAAESALAYSNVLEGAEGFRFQGRKHLDGSVTFERGTDTPLLSPRFLQRLQVPEAGRTGYFDRWALRDHASRRIFRRGNPFVDGIEEILRLDDRGQASAMWRVVRSWDRDPTVYLGVDFLVQADLAPALTILGDRNELRPVLRRRADMALAPFLRRVWMRVDRDLAEGVGRVLRLLDQPYNKSHGDVNLNAKRMQTTYPLFGGQEAFERQIESSADLARHELKRVTDLESLCGKAKRDVDLETTVLLAQAEARSRAGHLVAEGHGLDLDRDLGVAIADGVINPEIIVLAVSCTVLANESWSAHGRG